MVRGILGESILGVRAGRSGSLWYIGEWGVVWCY